MDRDRELCTKAPLHRFRPSARRSCYYPARQTAVTAGRRGAVDYSLSIGLL